MLEVVSGICFLVMSGFATDAAIDHGVFAKPTDTGPVVSVLDADRS